MSRSILTATAEEQDAVRHLVDAVNAHVMITRETWGDRRNPPYIGISLATGKSPDGVLYDTRSDCVRHLVAQDPYIFPVKIGVDFITINEAWIILQYGRSAKQRGVAFHHEDPVIPHRLELLQPYVPGIVVPQVTIGNRAARRARRRRGGL